MQVDYVYLVNCTKKALTVQDRLIVQGQCFVKSPHTNSSKQFGLCIIVAQFAMSDMFFAIFFVHAIRFSNIIIASRSVKILLFVGKLGIISKGKF